MTAQTQLAHRRTAVALGREAEDLAMRYLVSQGLQILARNFRCRRGEIDVAALEGDTLVIAEVRTRSSEAYGGAAASIGPRKQRRIALATAHLLRRYPGLARRQVRFDVLIVSAMSECPRVEWIRHAFTAS